MLCALAADFAAIAADRVVVSIDERFECDLIRNLSHDRVETIRVGRGEERDRIVEAARSADYTLVIAPETDGLLAERSGWIPEGRSLGSGRSAIELAGDKLALADLWIGRGLPHPRSIRLGEDRAIPAEFSFPAVLKPIDGAGGVDARIVDQINEGWHDRSYNNSMIQKFIQGRAMSAQFLIDRSGTPRLIAVGEQSIAWPGGRCRYDGGLLPIEVSSEVREGLIAAARSVPGLLGWVGIDFIADERNDSIVLIELNPRPTTSLIGVTQLSPPGLLALAWLEGVQGAGETFADRLIETIASKPPTRFQTDRLFTNLKA